MFFMKKIYKDRAVNSRSKNSFFFPLRIFFQKKLQPRQEPQQPAQPCKTECPAGPPGPQGKLVRLLHLLRLKTFQKRM